MKIKKAYLVLLVLLAVLLSSCATSSRGAKMKKTRKRKCNCPTFSYQAPKQETIYYV